MDKNHDFLNKISHTKLDLGVNELIDAVIVVWFFLPNSWTHTFKCRKMKNSEFESVSAHYYPYNYQLRRTYKTFCYNFNCKINYKK